MQDIGIGLLLWAVGLMQLTFAFVSRKPTLKRRLLALIAGLLVIAIAVSNLSRVPIMVPIGEPGELVFVIAGFAFSLCAFVFAVRWGKLFGAPAADAGARIG